MSTSMSSASMTVPVAVGPAVTNAAPITSQPDELLRQAIDLVQNEMLPAVKECADRFFDAVGVPDAEDSTAIKNTCDPVSAEAHARRLLALIGSLLTFLEQHGLSGVPLYPSSEDPVNVSTETLSQSLAQLAAEAKTQFERRDRIKDASAIVRGILRSKGPAT